MGSTVGSPPSEAPVLAARAIRMELKSVSNTDARALKSRPEFAANSCKMDSLAEKSANWPGSWVGTTVKRFIATCDNATKESSLSPKGWPDSGGKLTTEITAWFRACSR